MANYILSLLHVSLTTQGPVISFYVSSYPLVVSHHFNHEDITYHVLFQPEGAGGIFVINRGIEVLSCMQRGHCAAVVCGGDTIQMIGTVPSCLDRKALIGKKDVSNSGILTYKKKQNVSWACTIRTTWTENCDSINYAKIRDIKHKYSTCNSFIEQDRINWYTPNCWYQLNLWNKASTMYLLQLAFCITIRIHSAGISRP